MIFQDGDIVLEKVNDFGAWYRWVLAKGIQFFDGVYYHHALTVWNDRFYEATKEISSSNTFNRLKGSEVLVLRLKEPLTDKEKQLFKDEIIKSIGKKYDYTGTLFFQLLYILTFRKIWLGRTGNKAERRFYCTEFVADVINEVRGYFPQPWKLGPSGLLKLAPLYYDVVFEGEVK